MYNFSLKAITVFHKDHKNKANSFLALTSFGKFDHAKSGYLKDLKLFTKFSLKSTILFLFYIIEYANTLMKNNICRYSFVQYAAGKLF